MLTTRCPCCRARLHTSCAMCGFNCSSITHWTRWHEPMASRVPAPAHSSMSSQCARGRPTVPRAMHAWSSCTTHCCEVSSRRSASHSRYTAAHQHRLCVRTRTNGTFKPFPLLHGHDLQGALAAALDFARTWMKLEVMHYPTLTIEVPLQWPSALCALIRPRFAHFSSRSRPTCREPFIVEGWRQASLDLLLYNLQ